MTAKVDILLATYNGEKFLDEQLASLFNQEMKDFMIYIRDDGSTDQTLNIISKWKGLYPLQVTFIEDKKKNLGPTMNFNELMLHSKAPYICFSDQDDKWLPNKLSLQLEKIQSLEKKYPRQGILVFSDLIFCDADLNVVCPSLIDKDRLNCTSLGANRLLMQNVPYGCASIINRILLETAIPIDSRALLHDHWLAIIAALTGQIAYLDEALIYHRVHDSNCSRAKSIHKLEAKDTLVSKVNNENFNHYLKKLTLQAEAVLDTCKPILEENQIVMLDEFISLSSTRGLKRKWLILKNKFFKNTFFNTVKILVRA